MESECFAGHQQRRVRFRLFGWAFGSKSGPNIGCPRAELANKGKQVDYLISFSPPP